MKTSNKLLIWLIVSFFVAGFVEGIYPEGSTKGQAIVLLHIFVISALLFIWSGKYSRENDLSTGKGFRLLVAIIPIIGVPIFLFKHFGFNDGLIRVGNSIAILIAMSFAAVLGYFVIGLIHYFLGSN